MKFTLLVSLLLSSLVSLAQQDNRISSIDFVEVLNDNREETLFYYQNNWEELRKEALEKEYIHSYQLLEVPLTEDKPFQFMLITTYKDQTQYDLREEHFKELIDARGATRLLNEKQRGDFRKILFWKEGVRHWN